MLGKATLDAVVLIFYIIRAKAVAHHHTQNYFAFQCLETRSAKWVCNQEVTDGA